MSDNGIPRRNVAAAAAIARKKAGSADDAPSGKIRLAREILIDLLLMDDFDCPVLVGKVAEGLNETVVELADLAGLQELFETWVGN